jgi:hypothetical protein
MLSLPKAESSQTSFPRRHSSSNARLNQLARESGRILDLGDTTRREIPELHEPAKCRITSDRDFPFACRYWCGFGADRFNFAALSNLSAPEAVALRRLGARARDNQCRFVPSGLEIERWAERKQHSKHTRCYDRDTNQPSAGDDLTDPFRGNLRDFHCSRR